MIALIFLYLICSGIYTAIGISTLMKDSNCKLNKIFLLICINLSFWAFCFAIMTASKDAEDATFYRRLATFSWSTVYVEILYFILLLTGKERFLKRPWHRIVIFLPAVISIYLYYFEPVTSADIVRIPYGWAFLNPTDRGLLWNQFFNVYYISYMAIVILLLLVWGKRTKLKREKKQSSIMAGSIFLTLFIGSITDVILPWFGIPLVPPLAIIIIQIAIGGIGYSMIKYGLMTITNEKVVSDVFLIMNEGLIVLNQEMSIIGINSGALRLLGYGEKEIKGKNIGFIFLKEPDISKFDRCYSYEENMISKCKQKIPVLISSSALLDNCGDKLGNVLIFQDLTEIKQIQDKLKNAHDNLEIKVRQRTNELMNVNTKLENEIQVRIAKEEEIVKLAYNDQLTGLPNRRYFLDQINQAILQRAVTEKPFGVIFLDLDGFKMINDTMGHEQGDILLKKVAERLTGTLRKSDLIARIGGDEFIILIHYAMYKQDMEKVCEAINTAIKEPFQLEMKEIFLTTSIGVAVFPNDGENAEELVKNADIAMYKAKENGKGRIKFFDTNMLKNLDETMMLTNDLYRALEFNELEVYYQPQVNTLTSKIVGFEALLRWNHPKYGLIGPGVFIPIAEKTGLIVAIGEWVLRTACKQIKAWQDNGFSIFSIAVNLSVIQIQSAKIVEQVSGILIETGLNPNNLELEITETIFMKDTENIFNTIEKLKNLKVRIAIDDFGTEYSSLGYLKQLPLDRLKIAKSFVDGINKNTNDESIISAIIVLGKKMGFNLIAEGVETDSQLQFLKTQMCDEIQGFYFYKPMPAAQIEELFKKQAQTSEYCSSFS